MNLQDMTKEELLLKKQQLELLLSLIQKELCKRIYNL